MPPASWEGWGELRRAGFGLQGPQVALWRAILRLSQGLMCTDFKRLVGCRAWPLSAPVFCGPVALSRSL